MRYEEFMSLLLGHGWEPSISSDEHAVFRKGCLAASCRFSVSGGAYGLLCYIVDEYGKREMLASMSLGDAVMYGCYYGDIKAITDILCGDPTKIVKKFKDLYIESVLDEVLV